ncbi:MAG: CDP-diacylglycerol--serine O-phosphatidyltransferase [Fulvivirga sp.]
MKKHIPNFLTSCNLAAGCVAIVLAFEGQVELAVYLIWLAMIFDFFDGLAARALKVSSPIGKELDSLADMVSFGVVPAVVLYQLMGEAQFALIAFVVTIFSALRLAKFNTDDNQQTDFIGLPTPANALFLTSLVFINPEGYLSFMLNEQVLAITSVIFALLLVSPIRLFSLKFKSMGWRENKIRFIFLATAMSFILVFGFIGLPFTILAYIVLSAIYNLTRLKAQ